MFTAVFVRVGVVLSANPIGPHYRHVVVESLKTIYIEKTIGYPKPSLFCSNTPGSLRRDVENYGKNPLDDWAIFGGIFFFLATNHVDNYTIKDKYAACSGKRYLDGMWVMRGVFFFPYNFVVPSFRRSYDDVNDSVSVIEPTHRFFRTHRFPENTLIKRRDVMSRQNVKVFYKEK